MAPPPPPPPGPEHRPEHQTVCLLLSLQETVQMLQQQVEILKAKVDDLLTLTCTVVGEPVVTGTVVGSSFR